MHAAHKQRKHMRVGWWGGMVLVKWNDWGGKEDQLAIRLHEEVAECCACGKEDTSDMSMWRSGVGMGREYCELCTPKYAPSTFACLDALG